jgi:predicted nucleotidyltransferase component of viral defense system
LTIDRGTAESVAGRTGFRRGSVEKSLRLVALLDEIARDRFLGPRVVLKGGTGLNLFYGELRRLSIDADLDYIGAVGLQDMTRERPEVLRALDDLGTALGYKPRRHKDLHAGTVTHFRFSSLAGGKDLIKVDLNFLNRVPVLGRIELRPPHRDLGFDGVNVPSLPQEEIAGSKLATFCIRAAPRDLYDVANFEALGLEPGAVRKVALFHGFMADLQLNGLDIGAASRVSAKDLKDKLQALLSRNTPLNREEVAERARPWTQRLLPLQTDERRFQEGLTRGVVEPRLLFGDLPVHPRLAEHPGLRWRMSQTEERR